jgi:hypothetical protein
LVSTQESFEILLVKVMNSENSFENDNFPFKREPFQITIKPPEAPFEGRNSTLLKFPWTKLP